MPKETVAIIGVGLMGSRMAARLLDAGYDLRLWNRTAQKCEPLEAKGAYVGATPSDAVTGADVVITMLSDAHAIADIYLGSGNVAAAAKKGAVLVDMSSQSPTSAKELHDKLAAMGIAHIDAPVSGGVTGAADGTMSIMAGGAEQHLAMVFDVLDTMGNVFHLGDGGAGQICKLVNQTIVHVTIGAVSEGMMLATALGVDAGRVREAIGGGFCQSRILELHGDRMVKRDFVPGGPLKFAIKDMKGALEHAQGAALDLPLTQSVMEDYEGMMAAGQGEYDHSALVLAYEARNTPHRVSPNVKDKVPE